MHRFIRLITISLYILLLLSQTSLGQFRNIRIDNTGFNNYQPNEVCIAVNPADPNMIAAGANISYLYYSTDGGFTWTTSNLESSFHVAGDPSLTYDGLGNLYYGHLSAPPFGYWLDRIVVQKSSDFGVQWSNGSGIGHNPPNRKQDKEWLTADLSQSQHRNNIYMAWTEFDEYGSILQTDSTRILFSRSTDHGETWDVPVRVSDKAGNCHDDDLTVEGAVPAYGLDGEVYLSWSGPLGIMFDKSLDGGVTFGKDVFVADQPGGWNFRLPGAYVCSIPGLIRANGFPVTVCDNSDSPHRGSIYINWSDQRNGLDNTDIFFSKSIDGGATWSSPLKVNNDDTHRHQYFNWMTVDQTTGFIYIIFYDRRNTVKEDTEVYLAVSIDGGSSFKNVLISEEPFSSTDGIFLGDYIGITAYNGKVHPIWCRADMIANNTYVSVITAVIDDYQVITHVDDESEVVINEYRLMQNYPNPFNPTTTIGYQVPEKAKISLKVYDVLGNEIETLVDEEKMPGVYEVNFNGSKLSSGTYIYKLYTTEYSQSGKMILLK